MSKVLAPEEELSEEAPDIESSSDAYATRFSGPVGEWMLSVQERITLSMLRIHPHARILDVGGGHGQLARPLSKLDYDVTVLGSDPVCSKRIQDLVDSKQCKFVVGDINKLPFEDEAFDIAMSFRIMAHTQHWQQHLHELCRVARTAVIFDYPTKRSFNAIAPALFGAKKKFEKNTRHWSTYTRDQIHKELTENSFIPLRDEREFFFPMVAHRMLHLKPLSVVLDTTASLSGLKKVWGSPVIVKARRLT